MPPGKEIGLGLGHIVLDWDPVGTQPPTAAPPHFRPMPIVAKRSPISATAEHLLVVLLNAAVKQMSISLFVFSAIFILIFHCYFWLLGAYLPLTSTGCLYVLCTPLGDFPFPDSLFCPLRGHI